MNSDELLQRRTEAEKLLAAGNFADAEATYRLILEADAKNIYALMGLGNVARAKPDMALAEQCYREAAAIHPRNAWPWFTLVAFYAGSKRWDDGEEAAKTAFSISANDFQTAMALGRLRRDRGDLAAAAAAFEIACVADPKSAGAVVERGRTLIALDRLSDAEAAFRAGLEQCPATQHGNLLRALADLARKRGDSKATVDWLQRAVEISPQDASLKGELATAGIALAKATGDKSAHVAAVEAAHRAAPEDFAILIELAAIYRDAGRYDEADTLYRQGLTIKPNHLSAMLGLGGVARRRGQHQTALDHYQQARVVHPSNSWISVEIAKSLRDLSRLDEAEAVLRGIDPADPQRRYVLLALADIARERGDRVETIRLMRAAAKCDANPLPVLANAANEALQIRDFAAAREIADEMTAHDPQAMQASMLEGRICRATLDRVGAHAAFSQAVARAPSSAAPLVELAIECLALGQTSAADAHLEQALTLEPANLQGLLQLAERCRAWGDDERALELFAKARQAHPAQPWPYLNSAQVLGGLGRIEEACRLLAQGREACGATPGFFAREAAMLQEAGFLDRAMNLFEQGHGKFPNDMWLWAGRAMLATQLGNFALTESMLANSPASSPTDEARALIVGAKLAEARWQLEDADILYRRVIELDPANASAVHEIAKLALFRFDLAEARNWLMRHATLQRGAIAAAGRSINITQSQLGQIYDEFAIQPKLIGTLAALSTQPAWSRLAGIEETVASNPDATAPAIALMIALRRTGAFENAAFSVTAGAAVASPSIPRVISQYWDAAEPPADIRAMIDGWKDAHPAWRHVLYDDRSALAFLQSNAAPAAARAFQRIRDRTQRADLFRLALLYAQGGVYIDADDRCRGPLERILPAGKTFVAFQEDYGSIANNFLAVEPGHAIIKRALESTIAALERGDRDIAWLSTGPGMLTRAFAAEIAARVHTRSDILCKTTVLERHTVRASLVPYCQAGYKRTARHWQNAAFPSSGSVRGQVSVGSKKP